MFIKNRALSILTLFVLLFVGAVVFYSLKKPVDVVIQAGHEGRLTGNTGAESALFKESKWNVIVADEAAKKLRSWGIKVIRIPARVHFVRAKIAVAIHFDGAKSVCASGASIGYPNEDSEDFAAKWKRLYGGYFPFRWHKDNFTKNLRNYYAYRWIRADKFLLLELGEITCNKQAKWLHPKLKKIAHLVAYAIATELGKDVKKPQI